MSSILSYFTVLLGAVLIVNGRIFGRRLREAEPCNNPGFFASADDCRIFYRCAEHPSAEEGGPPVLLRYTFRCPNGTVFDEIVSTCNHPDAVMNKPENCQVYDPEEPSGDGDGQSSGSGYGYTLSLGNQMGITGNTIISQQHQQQSLGIPNNQIIYLPTLTIPHTYGNLIQYG